MLLTCLEFAVFRADWLLYVVLPSKMLSQNKLRENLVRVCLIGFCETLVAQKFGNDRLGILHGLMTSVLCSIHVC